MASSGKDTVVLVDGYNLSEYFTNADSNLAIAALPCHGFGSSSKKYVPGLKEGGLSLQGFYETSHGAIDELLRAIFAQVTGQVVTVGVSGLAHGAGADVLTPKTSSYAKTAALEDVNKATVEMMASGGIDYAVSLHALTAETFSGVSAAHDNAAASSNGGVAHLHVTGIVGDLGEFRAVVEHSTDGVTWAVLASFDPRTGIGGQRVTVTGTINRYTRVTWDITGTDDPQVTFAAVLARR